MELLQKLVTEKQRASAHRQNAIRQKIRELNFYYSDFPSLKDDFTVEDLESLIRSGEIIVIDGDLQGGRPDGLEVRREHLVKLLLEQYKQECLWAELKERGLIFGNISVNNLDIVLEMIGFKKDNPADDDPDDRDEESENEDIPGEQWSTHLHEKYFEMTGAIPRQRILITDKGLRIERGTGLQLVMKKLTHYTDWLYTEQARSNES